MKTGWYAILWCFDPDEGFLPGVEFWQEESVGWANILNDSAISHRSPEPFATRSDAQAWSAENNPDSSSVAFRAWVALHE